MYRKIEYVVTSGYASMNPSRSFDNRKDAEAFYEKEANVPSYIRSGEMQPAALYLNVTTSERLKGNRK